MAFEPPPMQATSVSGRRPSASIICCARLRADDRLEIADHRRIGMRTRRRADEVISVANVGDPIAQRFVHGVFQRAGAGRHRIDLGAEQASCAQTFGACRSTSVAPM